MSKLSKLLRRWRGLQHYNRPIASYDNDQLATWDKNISFLTDRRFTDAYRAGMDSGHHIARERGSHADIHVEWRVHVAIWAAAHGARLEGDFVECGVNTGMYALAICRYLDFNRLGRKFFLFDTYNGIPVEQMSDNEKAAGREANSAASYSDCYDIAVRNFRPYPNAILVRGRVPETLAEVNIDKVAYLSLDMNIAAPERAAMEHFWPRMVPGAMVVLDDYAWLHYEDQKATMDEFAAKTGVEILTLPTGQGLIIKP